MTLVVCCPNCNDDMIATKHNRVWPYWICPTCGHSGEVPKEQLQMWREAYDRGFQR